MGKDRLKRLLIILLIIGFLLIGGKVFADWQAKKKASGEQALLSAEKIGEKISDFGESVLGKAIEVLPGGRDLKEKIVSEEKTSSGTTPSVSDSKEEKVIKVETKTQEIIEIIKELPAAELEKIKKQIFKDFCQSILKEETDGGN